MKYEYEYDETIFLGRMAPFHRGHYEVVREALERSERLIIVLGSAKLARSARNPMSVTQREHLIRLSLTKEENLRVIVTSVRDFPYNEPRWIAAVQQAVYDVTEAINGSSYSTRALIGYAKDHTSYYLKMFPQWDSVGAHHNAETMSINATDIRNFIYEDNVDNAKNLLVNDKALEYVKFLARADIFKNMKEEDDFNKMYKQQWAAAPYPVTLQTVDSVVTCAGHILLIRRKSAPGRGLLAMPGGYIDVKETMVESMIRELYEETKIKVPKSVIQGSIVSNRRFDAVDRSARGRVITEAFRVDLKVEMKDGKAQLPKVKGSDDALKAMWVPLSHIDDMQDQFFEDHFFIIEEMLGL